MSNSSSGPRVLVLGRSDRKSVFGGDSVQIEYTIQHLANHGVTAELKEVTDCWSASEYDVVHFVHLPIVEYQAVKTIEELNCPVVISPVFWDTTPSWLEQSALCSTKWRAVFRVLGKDLGARSYIAWQSAKRCFQPKWREQRLILESVDFLLPNSKTELAHLAGYFVIPPKSLAKRALVVPNGVDTHLFTNSSFAANEFYAKFGLRDFVLEVARIERAKGQLKLIKALRDVPVPLVFIGKESPYEPDYGRTCREAAAERGNTFFLGFIPHQELPSAYAAALVHALPSWRETPGLSTLEAAAMGCKVVSTSLGSARDYLGDMAWYCHPADLDSIRDSVIEALHAPQSNELSKHVRVNFTWDRAAELTYRAYSHVLEQS